MKNWIIGLAVILMSPVLRAGHFEVKVKDFSEISASGNYKVILKQGESTKVEVANDDDDVDDEKIICEVKGGVLILKIKGDTYKERQLELVVTYTDLTDITAKKGCRIEVKDPIKRDKINLNAESGGKIRASVFCKEVHAEVNAGGSVHVDGKANLAVYKISAGGTIGAVSVQAMTVEAQVTAGGEVICSVIEDLSVKITSGGSVSYLGEPEGFEQNITLGGSVTKMKKQK